MVRVLKKLGHLPMPIEVVMVDKGYDSEANRRYVHEVLSSRAVIPVRAGNRPGVKIRGTLRKRQLIDFDQEEYDSRVMVETVFSVLKRTMGANVLSRGIGMQHKELAFRALAYDVKRIENLLLFFVRGFLQS